MKRCGQQLTFDVIEPPKPRKLRIEIITVYAGELFGLCDRVKSGSGRIKRMTIVGQSGYRCEIEWNVKVRSV